MAAVVVFGGSGYAGGHIAAEAARRGHQVTAISRNPGDADGVTAQVGSVTDSDLLRELAPRTDVFAVATQPDVLSEALDGLIAAAIAGGTRLGVVGGAGSLLDREGGTRLVDGPDFPAEWKPGALQTADVLDRLKAAPAELDWFYLSPAALFGSWAAGDATGQYRTSDDVLLTDADGNSNISGADYALAFVDEIEQPKHSRSRFHVAY